MKIRGPKDMVDQSYRHLQKLVKGLMEAGYQVGQRCASIQTPEPTVRRRMYREWY